MNDRPTGSAGPPPAPAPAGAPAIATSGRVLGIDLGARRIGVAVSDSAQRVAAPATMVQRARSHPADHRALAELAAEYGAVGVVVGLPVALSGRTGPAARAVLDEVEELRAAVEVPVDTVDERLTTVAASRGLRAVGVPSRRQRQSVDRAAAAVLLQGWLDRRRTAGGPG